MTEAEFTRLLHNGHGRALLYARNRDASKFFEVILDACLQCYSVDSQTEGTRGGYMLEVADRLPARDAIFEAVLGSLSNSEDGVDAEQRFRLAARLADRGYPRAKARMYEAFNPGPRRGECIAAEFVDMDGLKGFLFAARQIGRLLQSPQANLVDFGQLLFHGRETLGEETVTSALASGGVTDPALETYRLRAVEYDRWDLTYNQPAKPTAEALALLAAELVSAGDAETQRRCLAAFRSRPFPGDPCRLLELARSPDERVARAATVALTLVEHPPARQFAIVLVDSGSPLRTFSVDLLSRNFQPEDYRVALEWYAAEGDRYLLHWMGTGLDDLWKNHPDPASEAEMLRLRYDLGPCCFCRHRIVKRLAEIGALSADSQAECAWDANDDIRELVTSLSSGSSIA